MVLKGRETEEQERVSRPFALYSVATFLVGTVLLALSVGLVSIPPKPEVVLLLLAALLSENFAFRLLGFSASLGFPLIIAAAILGGPSTAGVAGILSFTNIAELRARRPLAVFGFNFGQTALCACVSGWSYLGFGGRTLLQGDVFVPIRGAEALYVLVAAISAGIVLSAVNWTLTVIAIRIGRRVPMRSTLQAMLKLVPTQFALIFVGVLIAQVMATSMLALPLFLFPLLLARQIYQRYKAMDDAFVDTIKSLIGALEAKDPYTRGHSERVADYAVALAQHAGYDEPGLRLLEKAALLHDIGKLGISSALLAKPTRLTDEEFRSILQHPDVGARMIARIRPLKGLVEYVLRHHERFDGTGYPGRIADTAIPHASRVLAVADAYDAMTTNRAYRSAMSHEEAVKELRRYSGTQFDPELVDAFIGADIGARHASGTSEQAAAS